MASGVIDFTKAALLEVQEYVGMIKQVLRGLVTPPFYFRDIVEQFESIGVGSLTVVLLTGMFTGMVLALQSGFTLDQFGARSMVGRLVSASMVKELGPVLTGLMVAGRPDARSVRRAADRRPARQRVDDQGARPGVDGVDAGGSCRLGHRRGTGVDGRHRAD